MRNQNRRKYRSPDHQIKDQDERRLKIREEARLQSIATGEDESALLEALVIREAAERGKDAERALYIFDMEMEHIAQDQSRDAIEQLIAIVREATDEYRADPSDCMMSITANPSNTP